MELQQGNICVGRRNGNKYPSKKGYTRIVVLMPSSPYGGKKWVPLSPYYLKDDKGALVENIWQFSKYYRSVPHSHQMYSRFSKKVIWEHPSEVHETNGYPNQAYLAWREKGIQNTDAVRYPVGYNHRGECVSAYKEHDDGFVDLDTPLDYVTARKEIYLPVYTKAVKKHPLFDALKEKLKNGENLLIIEVDGPHQESLSYYKELYGVGDDFIEDDSILVTKENMDIMLNDPKHNFGHGYCLAMALLDL